MHRRNFLTGASALAGTAGIAPLAFAQDAYPSRAVTIITPFPPGGATDVVARPLAAVLEPMVKQSFVIENKAGAAGAVGAQVGAIAKPDGYTLLCHIVSLSAFPEVDKLFGRAPKFTRADFIPIARVVSDPLVVIVNDQQPWKSLKDFIDDAKRRPDEIVMTSSGLYGALHLPMALLQQAAGGLKLRHLPTTGGAPALTALLGNNAHVLASSLGPALPHIKAGKARPLAQTGARRAAVLPDVPTLKESGYDVEFYLWVGLFAPKGTPEPVITRLRDLVRQAAASDQFKTLLGNIGQEISYLDQPDFKTFWDADALRIEAAVRTIGKIDG
jgi:tripartite-type tricarboxylate transporter receptor subunit TctC